MYKSVKSLALIQNWTEPFIEKQSSSQAEKKSNILHSFDMGDFEQQAEKCAIEI